MVDADRPLPRAMRVDMRRERVELAELVDAVLRCARVRTPTTSSSATVMGSSRGAIYGGDSEVGERVSVPKRALSLV